MAFSGGLLRILGVSSRLKGNLIVGQSGGPTAVINQSLTGVVVEATRHTEIQNVYGALHGIQGVMKQEIVDLGAESAEEWERIAKTPCAALGSVRKKPTPDDCAQILKAFQEHNIRYFFYIGGNDSAETTQIVQKLAQEARYEMRVFHVPKTIDNDLKVTDHCPGYGSAARFVALAMMGDTLDNRSLPGIKIDVIMGRHAGFLTAASVLARQEEGDGPHLVYVPEIDFSLDRFVDDVADVHARLGRAVVAVSEGIHNAAGKTVLETQEKDSHGNVQLSGTGALGDFLAEAVRQKLGKKLRVRADTYGYLQRSFPGVVSEVDAREARMAGEAAVRYACGDPLSGSVALKRIENRGGYKSETFLTPLETVARETKSLPRTMIKGTNDIADDFLAYVRPLVGELPRMGHIRAKKIRTQHSGLNTQDSL